MLQLLACKEHVGRLDDGLDLGAHLEPEFLDRVIGNRGRHDQACDVDEHMGRGCALMDVLDDSIERIAGGNFQHRSDLPPSSSERPLRRES